MMPHFRTVACTAFVALAFFLGGGGLSGRAAQDNKLDHQRTRAAAVAQLVGVGQPLTSSAMIKLGITDNIIWPGLERAPELYKSWLAHVRDDRLIQDLGNQTLEKIGQAAQAEYFALSQALSYAWETAPEYFAASAAQNRGLTLNDLLKDPQEHRGQVIALDAWVKSVRKLDPPKSAERNGVKAVYETWLALDKDGSRPVCVLATQLPESLQNANQFGQLVQVNGYFFKLIRYGNDKGPISVPLVIAPVVVVVEQPAVAPLLDPILLRNVRHDFPFADLRNKTRQNAGDKPFLELQAYYDAVKAAARTPLKAFEASAAENKELDYGHLIRKRVTSSGKVVTVEGLLRRVTREETPRDLQAQGVSALYEGWIYLNDRETNPVCVIFPDLPEGVKVGDKLNYRVRFTGYFFKRYPYEVEKKEHKTILLIGPTLTVLSAPPPAVTGSLIPPLGGPLLSVILGLVVGTLLFIVGLSWWFRRGDQAFKKVVHRYESNKFANEDTNLNEFGAGSVAEGKQTDEPPLTGNGHASPPGIGGESSRPPA